MHNLIPHISNHNRWVAARRSSALVIFFNDQLMFFFSVNPRISSMTNSLFFWVSIPVSVRHTDQRPLSREEERKALPHLTASKCHSVVALLLLLCVLLHLVCKLIFHFVFTRSRVACLFLKVFVLIPQKKKRVFFLIFFCLQRDYFQVLSPVLV